jgi:phosphohistidine phosphatase SixA
MQRRPFIIAAAGALAAPRLVRAQAETIEPLLRQGGSVIAFRHALAPGTFDPPGFKLDDCSTQRNLNDEGREQARRIGAWFKARSLVPARVRTSPWCRCVDTASLAFGSADRWAALASPVGSETTQRQQRIAELRRGLAAVPAGRFEAWVTHQFVLQDLAGESTTSGEALVLRAGGNNTIQLLARATLS